jgi:hypothetical protein
MASFVKAARERCGNQLLRLQLRSQLVEPVQRDEQRRLADAALAHTASP